MSRLFLIATGIFIVAVATGLGGTNEAKLTVDLHAHRTEIRALMLRHTPVGSSAAEVLKFVGQELSRSGNGSAKIENGPATGPATTNSHLCGVKHLRVFLGQYYDHPEVVFLSAPMLMQKEVSAQWAFDEHARLVEIFVDKATEVY